MMGRREITEPRCETGVRSPLAERRSSGSAIATVALMNNAG